jgi:hypothetical protein
MGLRLALEQSKRVAGPIEKTSREIKLGRKRKEYVKK